MRALVHYACVLALSSSAPVLAQGTIGAVGDLYVCSYFSNEVLQFDLTTGAFVGVFASGGGLDRPRALEFGPNGNMFVLSQGTNSVFEFDGSTGGLVGTFATAGIGDPHGMEFMPSGNLLVANAGPDTVTEYDGVTGAFVQTFADGTVDGFSFVQGMHFRSNGNLLLTDQLGHRALEYDAAGSLLGTLADSTSGLNWPLSFDLASNGNVFLANHNTDSILELDGATGSLVGVFASGPSLTGPHDVQFGPNGNVFVSSAGLDQVVEFDGATGTFVRAITGGGLDFPIGLTFKAGGHLGQSYCTPAVSNSTGFPGTVFATGSEVVAINDVTLSAEQLPPNQFGYFLNSLTQANTFPVPNSQGALCVGGAIGRYNANVFNTGMAGIGSLQLDLANTPTPSGTVAIQAGETWNFTAWFRDNNPGPTSNFTNGVNLTFL